MNAAQRARLEKRVLVLAPTGKDAELTRALLERAGVPSDACRDLQELCDELVLGGGAALVPEEAVGPGDDDCLIDWLTRQPRWSDLPVLVLARTGADSATVAQAMDLLGNVTVLERPMRVAALVSAVRSALRARQRQYQIREHLAERERAAAELHENDRRKDEFLAVLAHELRNPLAPIRSALGVLRLSGDGDPAADRAGEMIERQVNHLVRLVDDLLEVSRITRGQIDLRPEVVEVAAVVRSAIETSGPLLEAARHELTLDLPAGELAVVGDPVRLSQVLSNLLNNAAKYTDAGGRVGIAVRPEGCWVALTVWDTGAGIPAEMLARVWEPFTQLDLPAQRGQAGLGIGLTLVRSLVELHGGQVEARSEGPGRGSEFVVRLPRASAEAAAEAAAEPAVEAAPPDPGSDPPPATLPRRVLVVDDNRDAAESLGMLLSLLGAEVRVAFDGRQALAAVAEFDPAVVVLDLGMPEMDGFEVARRIRRQPERREVALIALTGWGQEEDRQRTRDAGFDHHLIKPIEVDALEELLSLGDGSAAH